MRSRLSSITEAERRKWAERREEEAELMEKLQALYAEMDEARGRSTLAWHAYKRAKEIFRIGREFNVEDPKRAEMLWKLQRRDDDRLDS